jgi:transposase-like protein
MAELQCPECKDVGSIKLNVVRSDDYWICHYECEHCGYKWVEIGAEDCWEQ